MKKHKFKVGDRVEVIDNWNYISNVKGEGIIIEADDGFFDVKLNLYPNGLFFQSHHLKLLQRAIEKPMTEAEIKKAVSEEIMSFTILRRESEALSLLLDGIEACIDGNFDCDEMAMNNQIEVWGKI